MNELKANKQDVVNCFSSAGSEAREVLKRLFGEKVFEFDYRTITSFEKACDRQCISAVIPAVKTRTDANQNALISAGALYQLLTIQDAVNYGWKQSDDEWGWFPYWVLYTKQELKEMGEKKRKENGIRLLSGVAAHYAEFAGVRGAYAFYRGTFSVTSFGFPLCLKSQEMALWMGKEFESLFFQYYGLTLKEEE